MIEITGTLANGKYPRVLHDGNRFRVKTVTASDAVTNYPGSAANAGDTVDRWRPFANELLSPQDIGATDWAVSELTRSSDGQTITETTANAVHLLQQAFTFTAVEHVVAFKVERQTVPEIRIYAFDGSGAVTCFFDLRDGTVGTASGCTGQIVDLGNDVFLCSIYWTPGAGTGVVEIETSDGSENITFAGSTDSTLKVLEAYTHASEATLRYDLFTAQAGDVIAIAASNLWSSGARVTIEHDSNNDDTWTTIDDASPTDDGPIMFFFDAITSSRWRIRIDRGVVPEVGVFRVGAALQFERPFYAGFTVPRMSRNTQVLGNMSGTGQLLGRSKKRTTLSAAYQWSNLTYDWVRANLDGPSGLIQSAETEPLFVAWRPSETEDVEYLMRATVQAPRASGQRDLHTFAMDGEAWAYE